jgi:baculoviral IAP repeat-containing protein 6 (apollon)
MPTFAGDLRTDALSFTSFIVVVKQVLASYINPGKQIPKDVGAQEASAAEDEDKDANGQNLLPPLLPELLSQSCLIPALSSYLRNDSGTLVKSKLTGYISI